MTRDFGIKEWGILQKLPKNYVLQETQRVVKYSVVIQKKETTTL